MHVAAAPKARVIDVDLEGHPIRDITAPVEELLAVAGEISEANRPTLNLIERGEVLGNAVEGERGERLLITADMCPSIIEIALADSGRASDPSGTVELDLTSDLCRAETEDLWQRSATLRLGFFKALNPLKKRREVCADILPIEQIGVEAASGPIDSAELREDLRVGSFI